MLRYGPAALALVICVIPVLACRDDAGLSPAGEGALLRPTTGQCLAPPTDRELARPDAVSSRLASVFLGRGSPLGTGVGPDELVCLSAEEGRWRLRPMRALEAPAE
jgi:hypothetical protein